MYNFRDFFDEGYFNKIKNNFSLLHDFVVENIKNVVQNNNEIQLPPLVFNNALMEIYDKDYTKMKYHSDQCLDLETDSYIALFSCYEEAKDLSEHFLRKLKVKNKITNEEFVFPLANNSVILFSLSANTKYQYKIVLDPVSGQKKPESDNRWLGMTFRKSKTFIHFKNDLPYFPNGKLLKLADDIQKKEFYGLRDEK